MTNDIYLKGSWPPETTSGTAGPMAMVKTVTCLSPAKEKKGARQNFQKGHRFSYQET